REISGVPVEDDDSPGSLRPAQQPPMQLLPVGGGNPDLFERRIGPAGFLFAPADWKVKKSALHEEGQQTQEEIGRRDVPQKPRDPAAGRIHLRSAAPVPARWAWGIDRLACRCRKRDDFAVY